MNKIKLFQNKTVLQQLNYRIGNTAVFMKRDDLIDFGFGGNKVRLFEYIATEIVKKKSEKLITFGSIHSNHIRVAAFVATRLGITCDLIILCDKESEIGKLSPNLKLIEYISGVKIVYCKTEDAHDFIDDYLDKEQKRGTKYFWVPGGGHTALAATGYMDAAEEIIEQAEDKCIDAVFVPCGTGTTQAGLIAGFDKRIPVYGITVARDVDRCTKEIGSLLSKMRCLKYRDLINVQPCNIKYGEINEDVRNVIFDLIESDGICLDPVYNAKSFFEMTRYLRKCDNMRSVVYVNTGGSPNLFI